jgi:hypothetical protein
VAQEVGNIVSVRTVQRIAHKAQIPLKPRKILTAKKRAKVIEALWKNPHRATVAKQLNGVSYATVCRFANQLGIARAGWQKFPPEERAQIPETLRQNPNPAAVAKRHGNINVATVRTIGMKAGIKLPVPAMNPEKGKRLSPKQRALHPHGRRRHAASG